MLKWSLDFEIALARYRRRHRHCRPQRIAPCLFVIGYTVYIQAERKWQGGPQASRSCHSVLRPQAQALSRSRRPRKADSIQSKLLSRYNAQVKVRCIALLDSHIPLLSGSSTTLFQPPSFLVNAVIMTAPFLAHSLAASRSPKAQYTLQRRA